MVILIKQSFVILVICISGTKLHDLLGLTKKGAILNTIEMFNQYTNAYI